MNSKSGKQSQTLEHPNVEHLVGLRATVDDEIRTAVETVLYPSLSAKLVEKVREHDPLIVFQGIDGIAMFLRRYARARKVDGRNILLSARGGVSVPGTDAEPTRHDVLVKEVEVTTGLEQMPSENLLAWIVDGARELPRFFVGARSGPSQTADVTVRVEHRLEDIDLARYWAPTNQTAR